MTPADLETGRVRLRRWRSSDLEAFAAINTDPSVMEFLPRPLSRHESDAMVERIEEHFDAHGFGLWALEIPGLVDLGGFVGLWPATFRAHFTPAVEVGWRLARHCWGHGYATEAAQAVLLDGFGRLGLDEVVSFTAVVNERSVAVMRRLGMSSDPADDFDHPSLPPGHVLSPHVLYRLAGSRYETHR